MSKDFPVPGCVAANRPQSKKTAGKTTFQKKKEELAQKTTTNKMSKKQQIKQYKDNLLSHWCTADELDLTLADGRGHPECKYINTDDKPKYFTKGNNDKYQYDLKIYDEDGQLQSKRYRPIAWRVPFLEDENFGDNVKYTVSHLCHNEKCYNWEHHVLETLEVNKARNGCPAGKCCRHKVKCLIPGPYCDA